MTVTVDIDDQSQFSHCPDENLCHTWAQTCLQCIGNDADCNLSIRFVDAEESAALNLRYRNKESATNVLSFPSEAAVEIVDQLGYYPLGDLVICPAVLESEAKAQGKKVEDHWAHILIHGILHLCGHDHQEDQQAEAMENLEIEILKTLGIANPYLIG